MLFCKFFTTFYVNVLPSRKLLFAETCCILIKVFSLAQANWTSGQAEVGWSYSGTYVRYPHTTVRAGAAFMLYWMDGRDAKDSHVYDF